LQTIRHFLEAVLVIGTTARPDVQHAAGKPRQMDLPIILIFEFYKATARAPVAQRFPLLGVHLLKRLRLPEWGRFVVQQRLSHPCQRSDVGVPK
jgi:hypothetical protein